MIWHTKLEKEIIKKYGGTPKTKYGSDGTIRGRPCEVRAARKDNRYRIGKEVHKELVSKQGSYIFVQGSQSKKVPAREVSRILGKGKWFEDRGYKHRFVKKNAIFR